LEYNLRRNNGKGDGAGIYVKLERKYVVLPQKSIFVDRIFGSIFIKLEIGPDSKNGWLGYTNRPSTNHPSLSATDKSTN
jgi:hypothetical protein